MAQLQSMGLKFWRRHRSKHQSANMLPSTNQNSIIKHDIVGRSIIDSSIGVKGDKDLHDTTMYRGKGVLNDFSTKVSNLSEWAVHKTESLPSLIPEIQLILPKLVELAIVKEESHTQDEEVLMRTACAPTAEVLNTLFTAAFFHQSKRVASNSTNLGKFIQMIPSYRLLHPKGR
ncbi:hypothetical protein Ancab_029313 [Ancistrocladus abbreviatus]